MSKDSISKRIDDLPKASIITVNTNEKHRLLSYFPSIVLSLGDYEIIISDNGSTDGSQEFIRTNYPEIKLLENHENLGFAAANNRGSTIAQNEILVFLNPDTTVKPDWLIHLLEPFNNPQVGLVTSKILMMPEPNKINTCGNVIHISGITTCRGLGEPSNLYSDTEEIGAVSGAAFAIRKEIYKMLNGFDEDFFVYMEETDLSLRARLMGWKIIYAPQSIVYHDYRLRFGPKKVYLQERNRYYMLMKNLRWKTIIILIPILLMTELITWCFVILRDGKNFLNKFNAYYWIVCNLGTILRKRKINQKQRKALDCELLKQTVSTISFDQITEGFTLEVLNIIFNPAYKILSRISLALIKW